MRPALPRLILRSFACTLAALLAAALPARNSDPTCPGTCTCTFSVTDGTLTRSATYTLTVTTGWSRFLSGVRIGSAEYYARHSGCRPEFP